MGAFFLYVFGRFDKRGGEEFRLSGCMGSGRLSDCLGGAGCLGGKSWCIADRLSNCWKVPDSC